jgi:hypothetical protein
MTHPIIKTENYLLVVDDSDMVRRGFRLDITRMSVGIIDDDFFYNTRKDLFKKIISHLPLNGASVLEGVDLLPPIEDDVEQLAKLKYPIIMSPNGRTLAGGHYDIDVNYSERSAYKYGYNKAREKFLYTEKGLIEYSNWLFKWCEYNKYRKLIDGVKPYGSGEFISDKDMFDKFLKEKSLHQYPTAFECEMLEKNNYHDSDEYEYVEEYVPKTTTINGHRVWVGKYIF